jgi:hypothetical protein
MTILAIIVAIALGLLAFRLVAGVVKFGIIAIIVVAIIWFLTKGGGIS